MVESTPTITTASQAPSHLESVDFVMTFSVKAPSTPNEAKAITQQAKEKEYTELLRRLEGAGLDAVGRKANDGEIMILVRLNSEERLRAEAKRERLAGFMYGSAKDPKGDDEITTADRSRLIYGIITSPLSTGSASSLLSANSTGPTAGLIDLPHSTEFPSVTSIFPPHDPKFNKAWMKRYTSTLTTPIEELDTIREHFGESIAMYFSFLSFYAVALAFPAVVGTLFWFAGTKYSTIYSTLLVGWSIVYVESWKLKEKSLAIRWGTYGIKQVPEIRQGYQAAEGGKGEEVWWKTFGRSLATVPIVCAFALGLGALISCIYVIETLIGEIYDGAGKKYLTLLPTVLFVGLVPRVTGIWHDVAIRLTKYENHPQTGRHEKSLTLKLLALNFLTAYGGLLISAYVYIPFGHLLIPKILSILPSHGVSLASTAGYAVNSARLHNQLVAYTLTGQISGAFLEIGLPFLKSHLSKSVKKVSDHRKGTVVLEDGDNEDERELLRRLREECVLPEYSLFGDYVEMIVQFGYVALFSAIWPLASATSFVNNFFEQRGDAFKLCTQVKRPIPTRTASIGPFLEAISFIAWFSSLTNASLVYLFRPLLVPLTTPSSIPLLLQATAKNSSMIFSANGTATHLLTNTLSLHSQSKPVVNAMGEMSGGSKAVFEVLFGAMLVALASEHGFFLVRYLVRLILVEGMWKGSEGEKKLKEVQMDSRRAVLEMRGSGFERARGERGVKKGLWAGTDGGLEILRAGGKID